eukprot:3905215-Lingulodinium_polyedra.AAC.1
MVPLRAGVRRHACGLLLGVLCCACFAQVPRECQNVRVLRVFMCACLHACAFAKHAKHMHALKAVTFGKLRALLAPMARFW